jgi:hypothetical protein
VIALGLADATAALSDAQLPSQVQDADPLPMRATPAPITKDMVLVRAKATEVLTVASEPAKSDEMPGADIAHHLARHGVKVEVDSIVTVETDVASTMATAIRVCGSSSSEALREESWGHDPSDPDVALSSPSRKALWRKR